MRASRRHFLKSCSALSLAGAAGPFALNLAAIGAASASTAADYKAIVCVFLYGGNDHTNTFIPYDDASYTQYSDSRQSIAIPRDAALGANTTGALASQGGHEFAFHPSLTAFKGHWDAHRLAVLANVGPLVVPTTRAQYQARSVPLPPNLFSHNDQQSVWQAQAPIGEGAKVGWGGRIGDLLASQNGTPLFTCISATGNAVFLSGQSILQYQVGSSGPVAMRAISSTQTLYGSSAAPALYQTLVSGTSPNVIEGELGNVTNRAITAGQTLSTALGTAPALAPAVPANNSLASQLAIVARIISVADQVQTKRQVFLVSLGGFDNHDFLLTNQAQQLGLFNNAVDAFYQWLVQLNVQNQVTLFTASDFGRTLTSNGDGSDHGWGSHHFVLGGAVQGGDVYGTFQPVTFSPVNPVDIGQGNMVPQIAVDQYAATLARWMGVSDTDMPLVLPNIVNFSPRYVPFLP